MYLLYLFIIVSLNNAQDCLGGELRTVESYLYGRFEVNMKSAEGDGYVSSFFTYHDHWGDSSPDEWSMLTNEIDIEMTGNHTSSVQFTTHHPGAPNSWSFGEIVDVDFNPHFSFHDYAIEWTPNSIRWFVDDVEIYSQGQNLADDLIYPQKIMMNLWSAIWEDWVGEWNPNTMPVTAYYDYVKYYEYTEGAGNHGTNNNFTLLWHDDFNDFDSNRWLEATHGFNGNNCQFHPVNVLVHDGNLILYATETEYILGDVNNNSILNVVDLVIIVDMILSFTEIVNTADYNQDNILNVIDLIFIIDQILN